MGGDMTSKLPLPPTGNYATKAALTLYYNKLYRYSIIIWIHHTYTRPFQWYIITVNLSVIPIDVYTENNTHIVICTLYIII